MSYLTEAQVRGRAARATTLLRKSARQLLTEDRASSIETFDVFLSHSSAESEELLLGTKSILEDHGFNVYVDRYSDPQLSPEKVTLETAEILRGRMRQSRSLLYLYSEFSTKSRWMPWELGYFDGLKGRVGVLPVTRSQEAAFKGEEYLSLYPYVDLTGDSLDTLWISRSLGRFVRLDKWAKGIEDIPK